jgi:phage tail-like protein
VGARRGYLEMLPAIYRRSDTLGRNVARDICHLRAHVRSIEEVLTRATPISTRCPCPAEFLPWLASWIAQVVDMDWPEDKKRAIYPPRRRHLPIRAPCAGSSW